MPDIKLGTISFESTAEAHTAFWRSAADAEATLLCSVKASAVADSEVRDKFHALAAAVAGHIAFGTTTVGAAPSARWYDTLPCATCKQPQAADVLHLCGSATQLSELQLTPSGLPIGCCRVRAVGAMGIPDIPAVQTPVRRARRWF
jgi:hypothetical protein